MRVAIVGPGRLGRSLDLLLGRTGVDVFLAGRGDPIPRADVVLLTVPDARIAEVAASLAPGPVVLHTSGASTVDVLRPHRPAGSFHPLMTFPGPEVALPDLVGVPVALAGDPEAVNAGRALADRLGMRPLLVPGDRRLYHAAAVMAGNFATVLLAEAARVLAHAGVDPDEARQALVPLAVQSLRNAAANPAAALTGPAARGDHATIAAHRDALAAAGQLESRALYDALDLATRRLLADRHAESEGDPD